MTNNRNFFSGSERPPPETKINPELKQFLIEVREIVLEIKNSAERLADKELQLELSKWELLEDKPSKDIDDGNFTTTVGVDESLLPHKFVFRQALTSLKNAFVNYKGFQWARLVPVYEKFASETKAKTSLEIFSDLENIVSEIEKVANQFST